MSRVKTIAACWCSLLLFVACGSDDDSTGTGGSSGQAGSGGTSAGGSGGAGAGGTSAGGSAGAAGGSGGGTACSGPDDCRLFSSYCDDCTCLPLAKSAPDPVCKGTEVSCLQDPCNGFGAECVSGNCVVQGGV